MGRIEPASPVPDALNAREKEVLRLMAAGLGNYRYRKLFRKDVVIKKREWQRRSNDCRAI